MFDQELQIKCEKQLENHQGLQFHNTLNIPLF
jgi:hypothetical protein